MISVIYGAKGTGKTQRIKDAANAAAEKATGKVIYITDNSQSLGIATNIRFINLNEYAISGEEQLVAFLKGMLATDFDIQSVYIDGISRFVGLPAEELKPVFEAIEKAADKIDFVVTVSTDTLPKYLKSYAAK
ncbi:MAG: hypothetical protein J1G38_06635 [Clostridiales bacterium]|nr:hypothetical protein [Clostridiales bacterium]